MVLDSTPLLLFGAWLFLVAVVLLADHAPTA
jgi:hypothetical protein